MSEPPRGVLAQARDYLGGASQGETSGLLPQAGGGGGTAEHVHSDATQTDDGGFLTVEERFTTGRQGRTILAFSLSVLFVIFGLFILLSTLMPHGHGSNGGASGKKSPSTSKPSAPAAPNPLPPAVKDTAPVGSPTNPNPSKHVAGCPVLGTPPPGRRYIQVKNNCKMNVWPGILPAGATIPPGNTWLWKPSECKTLQVASSLPSFRLWGRTGCDDQFNCITGSCRVEGNGGCASAGETPCSLWEATLQDHCTATPQPGMGPDFMDQSLVDGFNLPIRAEVTGGFNVGQVQGAFSCQTPVTNAFDFEGCPYELRVYSDAIPGTNMPVEGWAGKNQVTSPCFMTPLDATCRASIIGCRSLCKALDQGWIGFYINNVTQAAIYQSSVKNALVDPVLTRPGTGEKVKWSQQFLQGKAACDSNLCRDVPAWGGFRGSAYSGNGNMKALVCCDTGFRCSPYQPNNVPGGCPYAQACPTLGSADPASVFHGKHVNDNTYPQFDEEIRMSSSYPDWPLPTKGANYAQIYKDSSPSAYSWQYDDISSTFTCCGKEGQPGPSYIITLCPDDE